jgi:hypothetical protein
MSRDYIPGREAEQVNFVGNFAAVVTLKAAALGVPLPLAASNQAAADDYAAAYATATDPATRTAAAVADKSDKRRASVASTRRVAAVVRANPDLGPHVMADLGLRPRDARHSPSPAPEAPPAVNVLSVFGCTARVRLTDPANPARRGKPDHVAGAQVFSHVGETAPANLSDWTNEGNTGRTALDLVFPPTLEPGARVWITARWFGPRFQNGPTAPPVTTRLPGGAALAAA